MGIRHWRGRRISTRPEEPDCVVDSHVLTAGASGTPDASDRLIKLLEQGKPKIREFDFYLIKINIVPPLGLVALDVIGARLSFFVDKKWLSFWTKSSQHRG